MIATHNIKVDGRWYKAGEELPGEQMTMQIAETAEEPKATQEPAEEKKAEPKPKTAANRRKANK